MVTFATLWIYGSLMFALGWAIRHRLTQANRSGPLRALEQEEPMGNIYAVLDTLANEFIGGLHIHKHDASAIRFFGDVAARTDTIIGQHPADYDLYQLGVLTDDQEIMPQKKLIVTGAAWLAAQQGTPKLEKEA